MGKKILNCGSLNIDYVYSVDHFVRPGETLSSIDRSVFCGGKGLNQSIALARAGASVIHCGGIGKSDGALLKEALEKNTIDTKHVRELDIASGHTFIQVDKNGQNGIMLFGGANQCFDAEQMDKALDALNEGDVILLQNETNANEYILSQAKKRNLLTVLNPSPMDDKLLSLDLSLIDYFILNEVEAADITGCKDQTQVEQALKEKFPKAIIVLTLGKNGAVYLDSEKRIYCPIIDATPVDTTAAGDTFTGYFFAQLFSGESPEKAIKVATAAATICITRKGAEPSIPQNKEVMDFLAQSNL